MKGVQVNSKAWHNAMQSEHIQRMAIAHAQRPNVPDGREERGRACSRTWMVRFRTRQLFQRIPQCASLNQCETIADRLCDAVGGIIGGTTIGPDEGEDSLRRMSAAHTDPSSVTVVAFC